MKRLTVEVYQNKNARLKQGWRWRLRAANGLVVGASSEGYLRRSRCVGNLEAVTGLRAPLPKHQGRMVVYAGARLSLPVRQR